MIKFIKYETDKDKFHSLLDGGHKMTHKLITKEQLFNIFYGGAPIEDRFNALPDINIQAIRECLEYFEPFIGDDCKYCRMNVGVHEDGSKFKSHASYCRQQKATHLLATLPKEE